MTFGVYLRLGRISNLPTVWTNVLAGMLLAGGPLTPATLGVLIVALSMFYVGGMYLNDAFDREFDARMRPERPIPSGQITATAVFTIGFALLGGGVALLVVPALGSAHAVLNWTPVASGVALGGVITYYDVTHKRDPLSPLIMGLCRVLVYLTAALAVAGTLPWPVIAGALVLLCYLIGLTYVAKQETLAEYKNLWPLAFLAAPFVYTLPVLVRGPVGAGLWIGFLGWVLYAISFLVRRGRVNIPRAVISFIAGVSLLDGLLIAYAGYPDVALLGVVGFALTLAFQRWIAGT